MFYIHDAFLFACCFLMCMFACLCVCVFVCLCVCVYVIFVFLLFVFCVKKEPAGSGQKVYQNELVYN